VRFGRGGDGALWKRHASGFWPEAGEVRWVAAERASAERDEREDREQNDLPAVVDRSKERSDDHDDSDLSGCADGSGRSVRSKRSEYDA
jgi:hypothetical protein